MNGSNMESNGEPTTHRSTTDVDSAGYAVGGSWTGKRRWITFKPGQRIIYSTRKTSSQPTERVTPGKARER